MTVGEYEKIHGGNGQEKRSNCFQVAAAKTQPEVAAATFMDPTRRAVTQYLPPPVPLTQPGL